MSLHNYLQMIGVWGVAPIKCVHLNASADSCNTYNWPQQLTYCATRSENPKRRDRTTQPLWPVMVVQQIA